MTKPDNNSENKINENSMSESDAANNSVTAENHADFDANNVANGGFDTTSHTPDAHHSHGDGEHHHSHSDSHSDGHSHEHRNSSEHHHSHSDDRDGKKSEKAKKRRSSGAHSSEHHHHHHHSHSDFSESDKRREFSNPGAAEFDSSEANKDMPSGRRRMKIWKRVLITALSVIAGLILAAGITLAVLYFNGKTNLHKNNSEPIVPEEIGAASEDDGGVTYNGAKYVYNDKITNFLVMGVDRKDISNVNDYIGANGQADAVYLVSINTETGTKTVFNISRDSMVDVDMYSATGQFMGTEKMQLCLAYSYGDGLALSCNNMVTSVSRLMYGIPIQSYAAIDLDSISTLVDVIGGLEVPEYDEDGVKTGGTITLNSQNATRYVRFRDTTVLDSNNNRRERQMNFIKAFSAKAVERTQQNISFPLTVYDEISGDMVTNVDASGITYLATVALNGAINYTSITGTVTMGEKYAEFNVDETALYETVLATFYTEGDAPLS